MTTKLNEKIQSYVSILTLMFVLSVTFNDFIVGNATGKVKMQEQINSLNEYVHDSISDLKGQMSTMNTKIDTLHDSQLQYAHNFKEHSE